MSTWDLNRLRYTIRKITGRYDTVQLPDSSFGENSLTNPAGIDDYINDFYLYDMPEHLRTLRLKDFYIFTSVPNCGTYNIPQNVFSVEPPIYVDNYQFAWYQSPDIFYRIWPELNLINRNLFTPNGGAQYTFKLTQTPVQQGSVVIGLNPNQDGNPSPILETFTDADQPIPLDLPMQQYFVNPAPLVGNQGGTGTIDYLTGAITLNYAVPPPVGVHSSCHYHPYVASRPRDIMFYQQQLFLRPIPNDTYAIKVMAYMMPTTVVSAATNSIQIPNTDAQGNIQGFTNNNVNSNATNLPQFNEWWQLIAYGAALKIFIEDGDHEQYAMYKVYFQEQLNLAQRKALRQLANQRIQTAYADNNAGVAAWPIFPIY
jgi:hypothetical protein